MIFVPVPRFYDYVIYEQPVTILYCSEIITGRDVLLTQSEPRIFQFNENFSISIPEEDFAVPDSFAEDLLGEFVSVGEDGQEGLVLGSNVDSYDDLTDPGFI